MLLLALDTSTSAITAALHDGRRVLAAASVIDVRSHGERLAPLIGQVLDEAGAAPAEVTSVVAGTGPGPFTGLRVGLVTATVFAFARGIPCGGVSSLDALAHGVWLELGDRTPPEFAVASDARRKEVYWATFRRTSSKPTDGLPLVRASEPAVSRPADVPGDVRRLPLAGRGPRLYPAELTGAPLEQLDVSGAALADLAVRRIAAGLSLDPPAPVYLRRPDALTTAERAAARV